MVQEKTLGSILEERRLNRSNTNLETLATAMETVAKAEDKVLKLMEEIDALTMKIMEASENAGDYEYTEILKISGEAYRLLNAFNNSHLITDGAMTVDKIVAGSITADKITAGSIATNKVSAGLQNWASINNTVAVAGGAIVRDSISSSRLVLNRD